MAAYTERAQTNRNRRPSDKLTRRELEVLRLTTQGLSSPEIATRLFLSPRTVESHRANMMKKLAVRNQRELIRIAIERGLIEADLGQLVPAIEK